MFVNYNKTSKT